MTDRELMQQALEALESVYPYTDSLICYASTIEEHPPNAIDGKVREAITALSERLAREDKLPMVEIETVLTVQPAVREVWCGCGDGIMPDSGAKCGNCVAADAAVREWQGLTEEDIWAAAANSLDSVLGRLHFARAIEAKLREKNHD